MWWCLNIHLCLNCYIHGLKLLVLMAALAILQATLFYMVARNIIILIIRHSIKVDAVTVTGESQSGLNDEIPILHLSTIVLICFFHVVHLAFLLIHGELLVH